MSPSGVWSDIWVLCLPLQLSLPAVLFSICRHRLLLWFQRVSTSLSWWATLRLMQQVQNANREWGFTTEFLHQFMPDIFSCDQAALWIVQSVRPSVRLSLRPSNIFDYVPSIVSSRNFQELLPVTEVTSMQKVKVTEVTTQLNRFRTVTPVWIHIWWNDAYSLIMLRRGALLFFKVIRQISRSHGSKNRRIWPRLGVSRL